MLSVALLLAAAAPEKPFPERVPGMIEACIASAVAHDGASETENSHKYLCSDESADRLWAWLEQADVPTWTQDTAQEGRWLSRAFPLGACFKRVRTPEGNPTDTGLSCSIWVPRPARLDEPPPKPDNRAR